MNFDLVPRARARRRGFRGAAACPCAAAATAAVSAAASAAKSVLLPARGPASVLRPRQQRRSPRRTASQVRGGRRQPAGRDRPPGDGGAAGGLREEQLFRPVQRQSGAVRPAHQEDPADAGQPGTHPGRHGAAARRSRRPSAKVSAAPSWWRWRRTIAARSISSRWRRRSRRAAAACSNRCSGRSRSSHRAAAANRLGTNGAERHLPHRLRAHLRRLLLSDFSRHQSGPLCRGRKGLPPVLPGRRGAAVLAPQSGRGHQPGGFGQQPAALHGAAECVPLSHGARSELQLPAPRRDPGRRP